MKPVSGSPDGGAIWNFTSPDEFSFAGNWSESWPIYEVIEYSVEFAVRSEGRASRTERRDPFGLGGGSIFFGGGRMDRSIQFRTGFFGAGINDVADVGAQAFVQIRTRGEHRFGAADQGCDLLAQLTGRRSLAE